MSNLAAHITCTSQQNWPVPLLPQAMEGSPWYPHSSFYCSSSEWINLVVIAAEFWDNLRGAPFFSESIQFLEKGDYYQYCSCLQLEALSATCDAGAWKPGSKRHLGSIWKDTSPEKEFLAMVPFSLVLYAARHAEKRRKRWSSVFNKEWSHEVNVQGVLRRAVTRSVVTLDPCHSHSITVQAVWRCPRTAPRYQGGWAQGSPQQLAQEGPARASCRVK